MGQSSTSGGGARKYGRNEKKCARYRLEDRRAKNRTKRQKRIEKRLARRKAKRDWMLNR